MERHRWASLRKRARGHGSATAKPLRKGKDLVGVTAGTVLSQPGLFSLDSQPLSQPQDMVKHGSMAASVTHTHTHTYGHNTQTVVVLGKASVLVELYKALSP